MDNNDDLVPVEEWIIDETLLRDGPRKTLLIDVPPPLDLIREVSQEAARAPGIRLALVQSAEQPSYFRVEAQIRLPDPLFDQLFNGRSGYRAQYYISTAKGAAFNRRIVDALAPTILDGCRCKIFVGEADAVRRSLAGRYSKIWAAGDGCVFRNSDSALRPERWKSYWEGKDSELGLKLPLPRPPQLDVKGSFVRLETDEDWVPVEKADRDGDIHRTGWA
jgi:hypothetical protein